MGLLLPIYILAFPAMLIEELLMIVSYVPALVSTEMYELMEKIIG